MVYNLVLLLANKLPKPSTIISHMLIRVAITQQNTDALEEMCDERTLRLWARTGKLTPESKIWDGDSWVLAKEYPAIKDIFTTAIWDAWEESLDVNLHPITPVLPQQEGATHVSTPFVADKKSPPPMLPLSAISPLNDDESINATQDTSSVLPQQRSLAHNRTIEHSTSPVVSTNSTSASSADKPVSRQHTPNASSGTSSVAQTGTSNNSVGSSSSSPTLASLWNPEKDLREQPQLWLHTNPPPKTSSVSFLRIAFIVIPGIMVVLGLRSYIITEATTQFPEEEIATVTSSGTSSVQDQFWATEKTLRSQLRNDIQKVSPENSLDDALRIELSYMKMDIVRIDASILGWRGRMLDEPKGAQIKIVINSAGYIEDELALIAMMVAKYTERYTLDMPSFVVVLQTGNGKALSKEIPTNAARMLLLQPGSLPQFFQNITSQ